MSNTTGISIDLAGKVALASLRSIIQAATLAGAGLYLGRKGIMTKPGAKLLSTMSMKVTIPCLLFSRVLPSVNLDLIATVRRCPPPLCNLHICSLHKHA